MPQWFLPLAVAGNFFRNEVLKLDIFQAGRFGYFLFFFLLGEGEGESEAPGGVGDRLFIENPRRRGGGGGAAGAEGPGGCLRRIGGGAKYFFSGPKRPPRM